MNLTGHSFIGSSRASDSNTTFQVTNPATGQLLDPAFHSASTDDLNKAIFLAAEAFQTYSKIDSKTRANFLRTQLQLQGIDPDIERPSLQMQMGQARQQPLVLGSRGRLARHHVA